MTAGLFFKQQAQSVQSQPTTSQQTASNDTATTSGNIVVQQSGQPKIEYKQTGDAKVQFEQMQGQPDRPRVADERALPATGVIPAKAGGDASHAAAIERR